MWSVRVVAAAAVFFSGTCDKWQQLGREKQTDSTVQTNKEMQQRLCVFVSVCVCVLPVMEKRLLPSKKAKQNAKVNWRLTCALR